MTQSESWTAALASSRSANDHREGDHAFFAPAATVRCSGDAVTHSPLLPGNISATSKDVVRRTLRAPASGPWTLRFSLLAVPPKVRANGCRMAMGMREVCASSSCAPPPGRWSHPCVRRPPASTSSIPWKATAPSRRVCSGSRTCSPRRSSLTNGHVRCPCPPFALDVLHVQCLPLAVLVTRPNSNTHVQPSPMLTARSRADVRFRGKASVRDVVNRRGVVSEPHATVLCHPVDRCGRDG